MSVSPVPKDESSTASVTQSGGSDGETIPANDIIGESNKIGEELSKITLAAMTENSDSMSTGDLTPVTSSGETHIHHYHYTANITANIVSTGPNAHIEQSGGANIVGAVGSEQNLENEQHVKQSTGKGRWTLVGKDIYINEGLPLCGTQRSHVYQGKKILDIGNRKKEIKLAVKIFHIIQDDSKWLKSYMKEVENMTKLPLHKNVAQFVECGKVADSKHERYIAMALYHKATLADIDLKKVNAEERKSLFLQICYGLDHLHTGQRLEPEEGKKPVAHMDLKPGNILFSRDGTNAIVSDFGISREVEIVSGKGRTEIRRSTTSYGGTQGWIAAEMLRINANSDSKPDYLKADIFSLGLVGVYTMCEKHHPFAPDKESPDFDPTDQKDSACWHMNIKKKNPPFLRPLKNDPLAADLFQKMLSHTPEERPDMKEVMKHCVFWDNTKRREFLKDMSDGYYIDPRFRESIKKQPEKHKMARDLAYEALSTKDPSTQKGPPKNEKKSRVLGEIQDVITKCWMDRVKELLDPNILKKMDQKEKDSLRKKQEEIKNYSLKELIRYIRNRLVHCAFESVEDWVKAFPKLIPYLIEIMEPVLTSEHKKKYRCPAPSCDIDICRLLGPMP